MSATMVSGHWLVSLALVSWGCYVQAQSVSGICSRYYPGVYRDLSEVNGVDLLSPSGGIGGGGSGGVSGFGKRSSVGTVARFHSRMCHPGNNGQ